MRKETVRMMKWMKMTWCEKKTAAAAGIALLAASLLLGGCQTRHKRIEIETTSAGAAGSAARGDALSAGGSPVAGSPQQGTIDIDTVYPQGKEDPAGTEGESTWVPEETTAPQEESTAGGDPSLVFENRDETVYVTASVLNVRASYSTSSQVVGTLNRGDSVRRVAYGAEWSRIVYGDGEYYAATEYLSAEQPETQSSPAVSDETETANQPAAADESTAADQPAAGASSGTISLDPDWEYADFSKVHSGSATLYRSEAAERKGITVCVNAGHGTKGGSSEQTLSHPDGSPKVTGGTNAAGAVYSSAISTGMTFSDGTPEAEVTLALALKLKAKLLAAGYDVLMVRESSDVQLDNIARTVIANQNADCHIALHWDSSTRDKGAFYMTSPDAGGYRDMEPVKSHWQQHHALGESLIAGLKNAGVKIFSNGTMDMDLTQTSYSTIPSVDIELGDKVSDHSDSALDTLAAGLLDGINAFFGQ